MLRDGAFARKHGVLVYETFLTRCFITPAFVVVLPEYPAPQCIIYHILFIDILLVQIGFFNSDRICFDQFIGLIAEKHHPAREDSSQRGTG